MIGAGIKHSIAFLIFDIKTRAFFAKETDALRIPYLGLHYCVSLSYSLGDDFGKRRGILFKGTVSTLFAAGASSKGFRALRADF
jgi:hypothetical protein